MDAKESDHPERAARGVSYRMVEIVVAAIVLLFGATFLYSSFRLGFRWGSEGPQSGYFPFYVSLAICGASAAVLLNALFGRNRDGGGLFVDTTQLKQVLSVLIPAAVYVLGIQLIGIYVASVAYITLFMRLIGKYSWFKSALLGLAIGVIFFMMFEVWFQVPLFKGYWNPTGWSGY